MMATLGARIAAAPENPDLAGLELGQEHFRAAIRELAPNGAHVEHE